MDYILKFIRDFFENVIVVRVAVAAILGAFVGFERELARKVAGMRTHAMVCLASAFFSAMAVEGFKAYEHLNAFDPTRMISNIIVGIGFIGAGSILKNEGKVEGTTTAASLWAIAAVGVAVGIGLIREAVMVTIIIYFVLQMVWIIEKLLRKRIKYKGLAKDENRS